jgi:hypothetical protein
MFNGPCGGNNGDLSTVVYEIHPTNLRSLLRSVCLVDTSTINPKKPLAQLIGDGGSISHSIRDSWWKAMNWVEIRPLL